MKKVLILRSNPVSADPRVSKIADILKEKFIVEILAWDRNCEYPEIEEKNNIIINRIHIKGNYGIGLKNFFNSFKWIIYLFFNLLFRNDYDYIHACDFDTYFPSIIVAKIKRKKIVYDIFDYYSDMIRNIPNFLRSIIKFTDNFLMNFSNCIILPDENRINQIKGIKNKKILIIPNSPPDYYYKYYENIKKTKENKEFVLGYIGLLRKDRGLDYLIEIIKNFEDVQLILGGYGEKSYELTLIDKIKDLKNVKFLGKVEPYSKTLEILSNCDVLLALYDPSIPNNRYASPNKIFEAMMLGKPIIVSKNTSMERYIEKYNIGYVVEYNNQEELKDLICNLYNLKKNGAFDNFEKNCRETYEKFFCYEKIKNKFLNLYSSL